MRVGFSIQHLIIVEIVQSKHDIFIKRKASCLAAGLFGRSWNGLSGRGWNSLLGRGWNVSCTFTPRSNLSKYIGIKQNYLN